MAEIYCYAHHNEQKLWAGTSTLVSPPLHFWGDLALCPPPAGSTPMVRLLYTKSGETRHCINARRAPQSLLAQSSVKDSSRLHRSRNHKSSTSTRTTFRRDHKPRLIGTATYTHQSAPCTAVCIMHETRCSGKNTPN